MEDAKPGSPSTGEGNESKKREDISDVVSFSLCALGAIKLNYLYPEPCHESFREFALKQIVTHFDLPPRVLSSIKEFKLEDEFTFLYSIKKNYTRGLFKLIEELVLLSVSSGVYDARSHYLIIEIAESLGIPRDLVEIHCESIYDLLLQAQSSSDAHPVDSEGDAAAIKDRERRETKNRIKKYVMIGLASLGGGAVIGVTGGLAAPIVASAFAGVIGAGTVAMSTAAVGVVGSLFGVAGAGLTASKMSKRIGDLEEFAFQSLSAEHEQTSLTITIAVSGWISDESPQQFAKPWKYLRHTKEQYCLCYESKYLLELSRAMDYLLSFVVSYATQEALKYTFLAGVMYAIAWPTALISIASIIDNPWDVCIGRAAQAGRHLADVLMSRQQGKRPASLIGFSLGARVIFFCLQELAERKDSEGIIGDVVLLGAPVTASPDQWKPLGRVVSGRIINGYSSSDWLLKFLYRTSTAAVRVAGLQEIRWKDRRLKNIDLTPLVGGHMDYYRRITEILDYVNIRTIPGADLEEESLCSEMEAVMPKKIIPSSNDREPASDSSRSSGIGRTMSNMTDISASLSGQSLATAAATTASSTQAGELKQSAETSACCSPAPSSPSHFIGAENVLKPTPAAHFAGEPATAEAVSVSGEAANERSTLEQVSRSSLSAALAAGTQAISSQSTDRRKLLNEDERAAGSAAAAAAEAAAPVAKSRQPSGNASHYHQSHNYYYYNHNRRRSNSLVLTRRGADLRALNRMVASSGAHLTRFKHARKRSRSV